MAGRDSTDPDEIWYPIPGRPGYEISSEFRVRSFWAKGKAVGGGPLTSEVPTLICVMPLKNGYLAFHTRVNGRPRTTYVHRVIAEILYGPARPGAYVRHFDDDKTNNYAGNLVPGTPKENSADARRNGRMAIGKRCGTTKYSEETVREVKRLLAEGRLRQKEIAAVLGIPTRTVSYIHRGLAWSHLSAGEVESGHACLEPVRKY